MAPKRISHVSFVLCIFVLVLGLPDPKQHRLELQATNSQDITSWQTLRYFCNDLFFGFDLLEKATASCLS